MTRSLRLPLVLAAAMLQGCALHELGAVMSPSVTGGLVLATADGETRELRPESCVSGDHFHFLGADLVDPSGVVVRAVLDPLRGPGLRLAFAEGRAPLLLDADSCPGLRLDVSDSGWRVNDFRAVVGELELDCAIPGGGRIHGRLAFRQCH